MHRLHGHVRFHGDPVGRLAALLCGVLLAFAASAAEGTVGRAATATAVPDAGGPAQLDEVTVQGLWKGPRLWRVKRGGHVLWLMGTPDLLPERMEWDASDVDAVLATAGELVLAPRIAARPGLNPLRLIRLYRKWREVRDLPGSTTLRDLLDAGTFARFETQRLRWLPRDQSLLHERPLIAVGQLARAAQRQQHLKSGSGVGARLEKLARSHRVPITQTAATLDAADIDAALTQLDSAPGRREISCLEAGIERLETDAGAAARRAQAWATGDIATLRALATPSLRSACTDVLALIPSLQDALRAADARWLQAVDHALDTQPISFAVRDMDSLLAPDGVLEHFRARGELDGDIASLR
jgi:uncharacterized protein YbaP (TraB family)